MLDSFIDPEDERRIHRLYALYCHFFAHGEPEEWVSIFTPDGVFAKLSALRCEMANARGGSEPTVAPIRRRP